MAKIIVAEPHGFCFGINRAIKISQDTAKKYSDKSIYFLGELVHNQHVVDCIEKDLKIKTVHSINEVPQNSVIILRAHGVAPEIYQQAKDRNLTIIDATCPLVLKSHQIIKDSIGQKNQVIFLCNKIDHDETIGVVGEAPNLVIPVTLDKIFDYQIKNPAQTIILTQTTLSTLETQKVLIFIKNKYPEITILPHICQATSERQNVVIKLAKKYKFVVIIGSPTSANSNSLKSVAESVGAKSYIVDNASELNPKWFINQENIVISSGASTPEDILEKVVEKIKDITRR
jgi:4-hydroxy-3-methylbut-2-en-1-yl diphosphate reductase